MKLATVRVGDATRAARVSGTSAELLDVPDVGALLRLGSDWRERAEALVLDRVDMAAVDYAPLVLSPSKIICVGLNYHQHALEMDAELPSHPTLFAKFAQSLVGANDVIELPFESRSTDWEAELVLVTQGYTRHCSERDAYAAVAGFTAGNDVSERSYQYRTSEWLQGKTWDCTTPVGPLLVTADEIGLNPDLAVTCSVDGEIKQRSRTSDMIFTPADVVAYVSSIMTLEPGDLIFLGTPSGVGSGRRPPEYLAPGVTMRTEIEKIGSLENLCVAGPGPDMGALGNGHGEVLAGFD